MGGMNEGGDSMRYCWEVFEKSECGTCEYFRKFSEGQLDLEKVKEIVLIEA